MKIFKHMEHVLSKRGGHVPLVPNLSPAELRELYRVFDAHGYASQSSSPENGSTDILKILFAHGLTVGVDQARDALQPLDLDQLIDSGLLYEDHDSIKARFQAQVYNGLIFFSDFFKWEADREFVLPIGPAGKYLALLTIRREVESALDLGCGCGIQSLLAARHSYRVTATDINPRALALTSFNAEFNNIHNIETRRGSYFEPVKDQRFDLIVANLPYVITPEWRLVYRTMDRGGDQSMYERLAELPAYLNEDGFAQLLINWVHGKDQQPSEPIRLALENQAMDAWLIQNGSKLPDEYAEMWLENQKQNDPGRFEKTKQGWLRWYAAHHIERIALGAITLRRRNNARNWFCSAAVNQTLNEPAGDQFLNLFAMMDELNKLETPKALLSQQLTLSKIEFAGDENNCVVRATHGLRFELNIHPATRVILQNLDGKNTLERSIQIVFHQSGMKAEQILPDVLENIQNLLKLGMILPVESQNVD